MATIIKHTAFEPVLTGPLLWVLTRGNADLRDRVLRPLASLPFRVETGTLVTTLKWLFALGCVRYLNTFMNRFALNKWKIGSAGGRPWNMPQEVAVITGGSGGIATEMIKKLAPTGMHIAVLDLQPPPAEVGSLRNVHYYECNITNPDSVHEVASRIKKELGDPTILVNNAGIGKTYNIVDVPNEYLEKIFHINLISHWYTVREFLPGMIAQKKGHVMTTASMAAYTAVAGMVDYCVTKAGTMAFHEGLNQELKHRYNAPYIKTTAVHPLWVKTALVKDWVENSLDKSGYTWLEPEYVGNEMAQAILRGQSGHLILPKNLMMNLVSGARGWAHWLHEAVNDSVKEHTKEVPVA